MKTPSAEHPSSESVFSKIACLFAGYFGLPEVLISYCAPLFSLCNGIFQQVCFQSDSVKKAGASEEVFRPSPPPLSLSLSLMGIHPLKCEGSRFCALLCFTQQPLLYLQYVSYFCSITELLWLMLAFLCLKPCRVSLNFVSRTWGKLFSVGVCSFLLFIFFYKTANDAPIREKGDGNDL